MKYWTVCKWCKKPMKTTVRVGHRAKCRRDNCGRTFKVYQKFKTREQIEALGGVK
jgi:hypothetical protein